LRARGPTARVPAVARICRRDTISFMGHFT
jgi:hypothetical protein